MQIWHAVLVTIRNGWSLPRGIPGVDGLDGAVWSDLTDENHRAKQNEGYQKRCLFTTHGLTCGLHPQRHPCSYAYDADGASFGRNFTENQHEKSNIDTIIEIKLSNSCCEKRPQKGSFSLP